MEDGAAVEIRDRIELDKPSDIWCFAHTKAELRQDGKRLRIEHLSPGATFQVMDAKPFRPPPIQADNQGRRKLAVHLPGTKTARIVVRMTPVP